MDLEFLECENSLKLEDFDRIEDILKIKLLNPIKQHYLRFNGGFPNKSFFTDEDEVLELEIKDFIPFLYAKDFQDDPAFTLEGRALKHWNKSEIPTYLLPFAMDWGGNYMAYNFNDDKIYYYVMDSWAENLTTEVNFINNSQLLADSFEEFLMALQDNPYDDRVK